MSGKPQIEVFRADPQDADGIAAVHVRAFAAAYRKIMPEAVERAPNAEQRGVLWRGLLDSDGEKAFTLVAEVKGRVAGFCSIAAPSRDADSGELTAEIAAFYIDPSRWRSGIGSAMLAKALQELAEGDWQHVTLWVLVENTPAREFYGRHGFQADGVAGPDPMTSRPKMRLRAPIPR